MSLRKLLLPVLFLVSSLPHAVAEDTPQPFGERVRTASVILRVKMGDVQVAKASEGKESGIDVLSGACQVIEVYKGKVDLPEKTPRRSLEIRCERRQPGFPSIRKDSEHVMLLHEYSDGRKDKALWVREVYPVKDGKVTDPEDKEKQITVEELGKKIRAQA